MERLWSNRTHFNISQTIYLNPPKTIAGENDYRKRKIWEVLEIKKAKYNKMTS